jgi:hypothetical protein
MIDVDYLEDETLNTILYALGWTPGKNDKSLKLLTTQVSEMSVDEAFQLYCQWNGLLGYSLKLSRALDDLRKNSSGNWQPVETLPKEGTFLVYMETETRKELKMDVAIVHPNITTIGKNFAFDREPISHWMHLPNPPQPKGN